jgi:hypothetical protein
MCVGGEGGIFNSLKVRKQIVFLSSILTYISSSTMLSTLLNISPFSKVNDLLDFLWTGEKHKFQRRKDKIPAYLRINIIQLVIHLIKVLDGREIDILCFTVLYVIKNVLMPARMDIILPTLTDITLNS